jgi:O-antigen/teichoic acid export membrane protein
MNIKHALLHNTGWKIIAMVFTFISNVIMVRLLGIELSGSFFYAIAVFSFLITLLRFGIENAIIYYASINKEKIGNLLLILFFTAIVQTTIAYIALKYFIPQSNDYSFTWIIIFVMSNILLYYVTSFYQVKKMYFSFNVIGTCVVFFQTILFAIIYFFKDYVIDLKNGSYNLPNLVFIVLSSTLFLQLLILVFYYQRKQKENFQSISYDKHLSKNLFKYSFVNFLGSVILFLILRTDFYFVEKYCSLKTLGNYVQAAKIAQLVLVFPGLISGVIFPYSIDASDDFAHKIARICRLMTAIFCVSFVGILFVGSFIFVWIFGKDFSLMFPIIITSFVGVFCLAINNVVISFYEGKNQQHIIIISNVIALAIIIVGDFFLVPMYGYLAAACIFSIGNVCGLAVLLYNFTKKTTLSWKSIFIFQKGDFKNLYV